MRKIQFLFLLICCVSFNAFSEESKSSFSILSGLQKLGINLGQQNQQQLLPPDQAFKMSVKVLNADTLIASFEPAKDYYFYRDKIVFEARETDARIKSVRLPPGKMKDDLTFGETEVYYQPFQAVISLERESTNLEQPLVLAATYQGCNEPIGVCYAPIKKTINLILPAIQEAVGIVVEAISLDAIAAQVDITGKLFQTLPALPVIETESYKIDRMFETGNFWLILASFFGIGLLLSFTPCVFPMFPILSGIIASRGEHMTKSRGFILALAYVLGMAITYALAGVAAGLSGTMLSAALQNTWVLGSFALVFVLLAFSMFGFYELQIPGSLRNKLSTEAEQLKGGYLTSVFGMGALSAIIVGPCVAAPLAGALLYISQTSDVVLGGSALFVMALGMGVPLLILGASAGALLPKAGQWMESIKKFFGVLLLGVAIWLLSPVVTTVVYMLLWATLLIISAIYLYAIDPLPEKANGVKKFFKGLGVIALLTGIALLVGVLSGSRDILQPLSKINIASTATGDLQAINSPRHLAFKYVNTIIELDTHIREANNKYVMVDFYADWCVSCKEMERFTFSTAEVQLRLKDVVLLKVDVTTGTPDHMALLKRFKLFGPPGILFIDRQGQEIADIRIIGFQKKDDFLAILNAVLI